MQLFATLSPDQWLEDMERKLSALQALSVLVWGSATADADPITDAQEWVHTAFHTYRSAMPDNHPGIPALARYEHDFIAALCALNFDDQARQLRQAFKELQAFHHCNR